MIRSPCSIPRTSTRLVLIESRDMQCRAEVARWDGCGRRKKTASGQPGGMITIYIFPSPILWREWGGWDLTRGFANAPSASWSNSYNKFRKTCAPQFCLLANTPPAAMKALRSRSYKWPWRCVPAIQHSVQRRMCLCTLPKKRRGLGNVTQGYAGWLSQFGLDCPRP